MSHIHDALRRIETDSRALHSEIEPYSLSPLVETRPALGLYRKHARLFWIVSAVFFALCAVTVVLLPKKYEAEMKLLVKNERQDLVVTAGNNVNTVHSTEISESQINSEIELLRSTDVLRKVALESGLSKAESGAVPAGSGISPVSLDTALRGLQRDIAINPVKKSDIIDVTYTSKSAEVSSRVLHSLADNYLVAHLKVHANPGTFAFFNEQAKTYQQRLAATEAELKSFRQRNSNLGTPDQNDLIAQRSIEAQTSLEQVDAEIADYRQRIARSENELRTLTPRVVTQTRATSENQLAQSLGQNLIQLQNRRTELLLKFNPDDPFIKEVDKEISDTSEALNQSRARKMEENSTDVNPVRQTAEKDMVASQVALSGLLARRAALESTATSYKSKMFEVAGSSVQYEILTRQLKENEENYLLYQKKREEARIAKSLDRERITNVTLIQAPVTPLQPSSPKVKLDLLLSAICALFVAATTVVIVEFVQPRRKTLFPEEKALALSAK